MRKHLNSPAGIASRLSILALVYVCSLRAQTAVRARTPTINQSLEMRSLTLPKISPDGRRVIYEESRTDWEANAFETDLWIADVVTGQRHALTAAIRSSGDAAWSPDGRWIAFLSDRPGHIPGSPADKRQVYVMPG